MQNFKLPMLFLFGCTLCSVNVHAQQNINQPRLVHAHVVTRLFVGEKMFMTTVKVSATLWNFLRSVAI
jgi:hypothetical protein